MLPHSEWVLTAFPSAAAVLPRSLLPVVLSLFHPIQTVMPLPPLPVFCRFPLLSLPVLLPSILLPLILL